MMDIQRNIDLDIKQKGARPLPMHNENPFLA